MKFNGFQNSDKTNNLIMLIILIPVLLFAFFVALPILLVVVLVVICLMLLTRKKLKFRKYYSTFGKGNFAGFKKNSERYDNNSNNQTTDYVDVDYKSIDNK